MRKCVILKASQNSGRLFNQMHSGHTQLTVHSSDSPPQCTFRTYLTPQLWTFQNVLPFKRGTGFTSSVCVCVCWNLKHSSNWTCSFLRPVFLAGVEWRSSGWSLHHSHDAAVCHIMRNSVIQMFKNNVLRTWVIILTCWSTIWSGLDFWTYLW